MSNDRTMDFAITPVKKTKRMTEDMALSDSVSGVSRSGRVRKKSAKLMEMEDFHSPFYETEGGIDSQKYRKKIPGKVTSPTLLSSGLQASPLSHVSASESKLSASKRNKPPASQLSPSLRGVSGNPPLGCSTSKLPMSSISLQKGERVIAMKQFAPPTTSFETLSGSAYLMGDDIHFITGEPVDSGTEGTDVDNHLSPLKIDVGITEEHSVSINEESGLKMKFILSPKLASKFEGTGVKGKRSSGGNQKRRKSDAVPKSSVKKIAGNISKLKKKKKKMKETISSAVSDLCLLSSGGMAKDARNTSLGLDLTSDDDDDDDDDANGEPKLIIAESFSVSGKSKKKPSGLGASKNDPSKAKKKKSVLAETFAADRSIVLGDVTGQQQSVYFKEKSALKKKGRKKIVKKKEKVEKKKVFTAYQLWCQENRKFVITDMPGLDLASVNRRLGEVWKALPDKEKLNWRRKAKNLSCKNSTLLNTGVKLLETEKGKFINKQSNVKLDEVSSSKEAHKPVGTSPLDVAAHLKLLGESLSIIGHRLTEHEGQIAVSGSLSVLLDSTLCALGPLLCLTSEVKQLDGCSKETQETILDNIAYIMPGL